MNFDVLKKVTEPSMKAFGQAALILSLLLTVAFANFKADGMRQQMMTVLYALMIMILIFGFSDKDSVSKFVIRIQFTTWLAFSAMLIPVAMTIFETTDIYRIVVSSLEDKGARAPDFDDRFFGGWGFNKGVHEELVEFEKDPASRTPMNMSCRQEMFVYFIGPEHQYQIRAYLGIKKTTNQEIGGARFGVLFHSEASESPKQIAYIDLSTTQIASVENTKERTLDSGLPMEGSASDAFEGVAFLNDYPDAAKSKASWFLTPLDGCTGGGKTRIDQYVVVSNDELNYWHPNKFLFEHFGHPRAPINFSQDTFRAIDGNNEVESADKSMVLKTLLEKVEASRCPPKKFGDQGDDFACLDQADKGRKIKQILKDDFNWDGKKFGDKVTIFKLESIAERSKTRITAFMFPK